MALVLPAADFSHRQHLLIKLPCTKCHSAATSSSRASDNLLPKTTVCAECHQDQRTPRTTPTPVFVAKFSHALHAKLGNVAPVIASAIDKGMYLSKPGDARQHLNTSNACEACHRGLHTADRVTKAHFPQMADCLVCHNRIEPPFSCTQCHLEGPALRPASHTAEFLDLHSSGKLNMDKSTCAVCHGRRFTCQGCH